MASASGANEDAPRIARPSNKGMKLTKLSAAPLHGRLAWLSLSCRLMPASVRMGAGTASQLIPGVRRTPEAASRNDKAGSNRRAVGALSVERPPGKVRAALAVRHAPVQAQGSEGGQPPRRPARLQATALRIAGAL